MRRMCRGLEFDICEMAFTTYLCARAAGLPFTAIPVFVTRNFHHWAVFINTKSGIKQPKDLEGRKVGVNRGYTVTTGLWARGILHSEYGVDLNKVTWIPTDDEHVAGFAAPKNVDYRFRGAKMRDLLLSSEIDAAIGEVAVDASDIQAADSRRAERRVRLLQKDRDLSDQPRRGGQGFGAEGSAVDRGRALSRV